MNRVGAGAAWLLAGQWARLVIQLAGMVVLSRILGPEYVGILAMAMVVVGAASVLGDFGLSLSALRLGRPLNEAERASLFWANMGIGGIVTIVVASSSYFVPTMLGDGRAASLVLALSVIFIINGFAVQYKVGLNLEGRFRALALIDLVGMAIGLTLGVIVAVCGGSYWSFAVQSVSTALVIAVGCTGAGRWAPRRFFSWQIVREHLAFGVFTGGSQVFNYVASSVDSVAIGRSHGAEILGVYSRAFQLVSLPVGQVVAPLTRLILPRAAALVVNRHDGRFEAFVVNVCRVLCLALLPMIAALSVASTDVLSLLFGDAWASGGGWAVVLAVGASFQAAGYVHYWMALAYGRARLLFLSELPGRLFVVLVVWPSAAFGVSSVAWVVVGGQILVYVVGLFLIPPRVGVDRRGLLSATLPGVFVATLSAGMGLVFRLLVGGDAAAGVIAAVAGLVVGYAIGLAAKCVRVPIIGLMRSLLGRSALPVDDLEGQASVPVQLSKDADAQ